MPRLRRLVRASTLVLVALLGPALVVVAVPASHEARGADGSIEHAHPFVHTPAPRGERAGDRHAAPPARVPVTLPELAPAPGGVASLAGAPPARQTGRVDRRPGAARAPPPLRLVD